MDSVTAIITTCKRRPEIVKRAIMSVINQTYKEMSLIVVDDSPSSFLERSAVEQLIKDIQRSADIRIDYIQHDRTMGACEARNTGLTHSEGTYIAYLDDDDEWLPDKIQKMTAGFVSEKVGLVYCNNELFNEETGETKTVIRPRHTGKVYNALILKNFIGSTSFPLLRKSALEAVGGFDPKMESAQDADVWLRISKQYEVNYVDDVLVRYYVHNGDQISKNAGRRINGMERLNQKNELYLNNNAEAYWIRHMKIIPYYLQNGDRGKAMRTWVHCALKRPGKVRGNLHYLITALFNQ